MLFDFLFARMHNPENPHSGIAMELDLQTMEDFASRHLRNVQYGHEPSGYVCRRYQ